VQVHALKNIKMPSTRREMQSLNGKVAALCRFISKATDKCVPFLEAIKKEKGKFKWTNQGEDLYLYLAVSIHAISAALVKEENRVQRPVYFVSKRQSGAETRYPKLKKLAYCLLITSRKLRHYF